MKQTLPLGQANWRDKWEQRDQKRRKSNSDDLRPFLLYFLRYPGPINQMDLSEYRREFPAFPAKSLTYLKGKRTILKKKGLI